jgi:hypothetical protein
MGTQLHPNVMFCHHHHMYPKTLNPQLQMTGQVYNTVAGSLPDPLPLPQPKIKEGSECIVIRIGNEQFSTSQSTVTIYNL